MAKEYVVEGAELVCSFGSSISRLIVMPRHGIELRGKNRANIGDSKPLINIPSFGICTIASPQKPCTPECAMWMGGKTDVLLQGLPALLSDDKLACVAGGGLIKIIYSGQ